MITSYATYLYDYKEMWTKEEQTAYNTDLHSQPNNPSVAYLHGG